MAILIRELINEPFFRCCGSIIMKLQKKNNCRNLKHERNSHFNAIFFVVFQTNVGPILLAVNSFNNVGNPLTLESTKDSTDECSELKKVAEEAVRLQTESGYPQAIIVSGISGSGKTHASMVLLRHLFTLAEGISHETSDTFKHMSAAFTVLRSLGTAQTATNKESSRIGNFIEVQVTENVLYRTKIHCYFLDQVNSSFV